MLKEIIATEGIFCVAIKFQNRFLIWEDLEAQKLVYIYIPICHTMNFKENVNFCSLLPSNRQISRINTEKSIHFLRILQGILQIAFYNLRSYMIYGLG